MVAQHGGLTLGQHSCFFQAPQQQLFAPVPRMLTSSGRRVTGTPKERAQSGR